MKAIPAQKILRMLRAWAKEVQETAEALGADRVSASFLYRGNVQIDKEGSAGVGGDLDAGGDDEVPVSVLPVGANVSGGWSSRWDNLGIGDYVIRIDVGNGNAPRQDDDATD